MHCLHDVVLGDVGRRCCLQEKLEIQRNPRKGWQSTAGTWSHDGFQARNLQNPGTSFQVNHVKFQGCIYNLCFQNWKLMSSPSIIQTPQIVCFFWGGIDSPFLKISGVPFLGIFLSLWQTPRKWPGIKNKHIAFTRFLGLILGWIDTHLRFNQDSHQLFSLRGKTWNGVLVWSWRLYSTCDNTSICWGITGPLIMESEGL